MSTFQPSTLSGITTPFKGNGRRFGYPTANFTSDVFVEDGVYFGFASMQRFKDYPCMIFVGSPETLGDHQRRIEAHIMGIPDVDYYGLPITVTILHKHRDSRRFESVGTLKAAMVQDEKVAKQWFTANATTSKGAY